MSPISAVAPLSMWIGAAAVLVMLTPFKFRINSVTPAATKMVLLIVVPVTVMVLPLASVPIVNRWFVLSYVTPAGKGCDVRLTSMVPLSAASDVPAGRTNVISSAKTSAKLQIFFFFITFFSCLFPVISSLCPLLSPDYVPACPPLFCQRVSTKIRPPRARRRPRHSPAGCPYK